MVYKLLGLLFLWATIIFTVMQQNDIIWVISAVCSILLMHFVSKWLKLGGLSGLGLQMEKGWLRYLLLGSLIGIVYQLLRFSVVYSTGAFTIHMIPIDLSGLIISTVILLISTAYIGFSEEIAFRGYLVNILPSLPIKLVVVISALLFAAGHLINGNFSISSISYLIIGGLFLAICYVVTRSLWFVAGIHWFWDFSYFYLGADGGASSAKIIDVTMNDTSYNEWVDVAIMFGFLLLLLYFTRHSFVKNADNK